MNQQGKIPAMFLIVGIIAVLVGVAVIFFIFSSSTTLHIYFDNVDKASKSKIMSLINERDDFLVVESLSSENADLYFSYTNPTLYANENIEFSLDNLVLLPSAMRNLGLDIENKRVGVALQLDHPELLIKKELLSVEDGEIILPLLSEISDILRSKAKDNYFPLMIAGAEDASLFDALKLLIISMTGKHGYTQLIDTINSGTYEPIEEIQLDTDTTLEDVLSIFTLWQSQGILHHEWIRFDYKTAASFLEDDLTSAAFLRLSRHRQLSQDTLKHYEAIPFPEIENSIYARDIAMVPLFCSIPSTANVEITKLESLIDSFLEADFQNSLSFASGLGPVNSNSQTLDKQASDVRFWAASSGRIIPIQSGLYNYSIDISKNIISETDNVYSAFLDKVREYLILNR